VNLLEAHTLGFLEHSLVRQRAESYNINSDRIGVVGVSSGAYLAAMIGLTDATAGFEGKGAFEMSAGKYPYILVAPRLQSRRDDIYVIGFRGNACLRLMNRHQCAASNQRTQNAYMTWRKMLDNYESKTALDRYMREELFECVKTTGRRTDPDDRDDVCHGRLSARRRSNRPGGSG
jgi:acetyl esterase/lipase